MQFILYGVLSNKIACTNAVIEYNWPVPFYSACPTVEQFWITLTKILFFSYIGMILNDVFVVVVILNQQITACCTCIHFLCQFNLCEN